MMLRLGISLACGLLCMPAVAAETDISGQLAVGWRTVSVSGARNKYDEDINLEDGPRLFEASLVIRRDRDGSLQPDRVEFSARNLGGDPFENIRLDIRRYGAYSFSAERRRSAWFYDDLLVRPEDASIAGSTGGDFHRFNIERVRDDLSLNVQLNPRAKLLMGFDRYVKTGDSTTTLDISRDEFELDKPVDEAMQSWRLGLEYRWQDTLLLLEERTSDYENNATVFLPGFSMGEDPADATTLDFYFLDTPYTYRNREHAARLRSRLTDRLRLSAAAVLGQLDLDTTVDERAQGVAFNGAPLQTDASGGGNIERDSAAVDLDLTYALNSQLSLSAGILHRKLEQDGNVSFTDSEGGRASWDIRHQGLELGLSWQATADLAIAAGWQTTRRDVDASKLQAGEAALDLAADNDADDLYVSVDYRVNRRLSLHASINDQSHDNPYSLASAADLTRLNLRARYRDERGTQATLSHTRSDRDNDLGQWSAEVRQTTLRISHSIADVMLSLGSSWIENSQDYRRLVSGGSRQELFDIRYLADTSYVDAGLRWQVDERWSLGGHWRQYDNDGSFNVSRDDWRAFVDVALPRNFALSFSYRDIRYDEDALETYDAGIFEAAIRLRL